MTDLWAAGLNTIYATPLAVDAVYRSADPTVGETAVRVILSQPDAQSQIGEFKIVSDTTIAKVRVSEIAAPAAGDTLIVGSDEYVVQGVPRRDPRRLEWTLDTRPA